MTVQVGATGATATVVAATGIVYCQFRHGKLMPVGKTKNRQERRGGQHCYFRKHNTGREPKVGQATMNRQYSQYWLPHTRSGHNIFGRNPAPAARLWPHRRLAGILYFAARGAASWQALAPSLLRKTSRQSRLRACNGQQKMGVL